MLKEALSRMESSSRALISPGRGKGAGILAHTFETAEYAGASALFGYVSNRWREESTIKGVPIDLGVGLVGKVAAIALDVYGKVPGVTTHLHTVSNAGIGAYFHTLGAGLGAEASGQKRLLLPKGADVSKVKAQIPGSTVLGEIPPAKGPGDFLSTSELAGWSSRRAA